MFCSKCGNADQTENSYCRNCGEFLADSSNKFNLIYNLFGITSPEKQITANIVVNFFGLLLSVTLLGFLLGFFDAGENKIPPVPTPKIIYFVYAFLLVISAWQLLGIVFAANLRSKFGRGKTNVKSENNFSAVKDKQISAVTQDLLPKANLDDLIISTVTDETTRNLKEKVIRSSQTEQ